MRSPVRNPLSRLLSTGGVLSDVPPLEDHLSRFFVQAVIILAICRVLSLLGHYLRQPRVIFEIIGGILLGPSAIGRSQSYLDKIFPQESLGYLTIVADIGLTFYLFLVGLELDPKLLMTHAEKAGGIALIGMAVPFALGVAISPIMFHVLQGDDPAYEDVSIVSFFVFIGTAMSITAFPVLARILKEGGLIYTKAGSMAMGAAALNDAIAWCLLTLAISIANAGDMAVAGYVFLSVAAFALGLIVIIRPLFEMLVEFVEKKHSASMNSNLFAFTICIMFLCAWTTALLGVHAIFGAFIFGLIVPRGSHLFKECNERIEEFVLTVTLPLYFALSGLKTDVTTIHTRQEGAITVLVCVMASVGKFVGAGGTAWLTGSTVRESSVIAVLMNTRGLVELIVLNLGMQSGILSTRTFSVMVIMCLFTTFITCPLVELIYPRAMRTRTVVEEDEKAEELEKKHPGNEEFQGVPNVEMNEIEIEQESCKQLAAGFSIASRVGVVVDQLSQLQTVLRVLVYFLPNALHSELAVTAVHPIEPTNSTKDEFIPLNADGKLIRIDEETTDWATALSDLEDPAAPRPELLPLSMFCRATDVAVNVFRVQGDPDEFPVVNKQIFKANECSLVLMPWRAHREAGKEESSQYADKLFWHTLQITSVPVVLFASLADAPYVLGTGEAQENSNEDAHSDMGEQHTHTAAVRRRGNSVFHSEHHDSIGDAETGSVHQLYSTLPPNIIAQHRRNTVTNTMTKVCAAKKAQTMVLALLTGKHSDIALFSIIQRFVETPLHSMVVCIPRDYHTHSLLLQTLDTFQQFVTKKGMNNVRFVFLESDCIDSVGLYAQTVQCVDHFDIFVTGFAVGNIVTPFPSRAGTVDGPSSARHHRATTISEAIVTAIRGEHEDSVDTSQSFVPARYQNTGLKFPELGVYGNKLLRDSLSPQLNSESAVLRSRNAMLLVVHESEKRIALSASRMNSTVVFEVDNNEPSSVDEEQGIQLVAQPVKLPTFEV